MVIVTIRAYNKDGYHKDIPIQNERQVHMVYSPIKWGDAGQAIFPADFPEMVKFEVIVKEVER